MEAVASPESFPSDISAQRIEIFKRRLLASLGGSNNVDVDEVVQEALARLWQRIRDGRTPPEDWDRYVIGIAINVAKENWRARLRQAAVPLDDDLTSDTTLRVFGAFERGSISESLTALRRVIVEDQIASLPKDKQILAKAYLSKQLGHGEVPSAEKLAITVGVAKSSVKVLQWRAMQELGGRLSKSPCWALYEKLKSRSEALNG